MNVTKWEMHLGTYQGKLKDPKTWSMDIKYRTRWLAHTRMCTKRGGPVFWIHENLVCPDCNLVKTKKLWSNAKCTDFRIWRKIFGRMISAAKTSLKGNSAKRTEQALTIQTQARGLLTTWAARSSVLSAGLTRSPLMLRWGSTGNEALWPSDPFFCCAGSLKWLMGSSMVALDLSPLLKWGTPQS